MEAINLCLRAVTKPGDLVALESPTFFGFLQVLETLGLRALEIPTHPRNGLSLDALELALAEHPVKAVLAMPTVSNPLGATMPDASKKRLVEMLAARGVPLIEDNLYGDLHYAATPPRAAKSFDRSGGVMLLSSFTKTLAPGLRVGWIEPGRWRDQLYMLKFVVSGGQPALDELAVADLLESGGYDRFLRGLKRRFESHIASGRAVIAESFPEGTRVSSPSGGYILWIELPKSVDSVALFERCLARGISIAPGPMFSASKRYRNYLRLGLGRTWTDEIAGALRTVGRLAHQMRS
jgi:DNA-binding transcriptional MocR family regulator